MKKRKFNFISILLLSCCLLLLFACAESPLSPDADVTQSPVFGASDGTYNKDIEVTISCPTDGAVIYYTLDGTEPDIGSLIYSAVIPVAGDGNNLLIKAAAKCENMEISGVTAASYTISYLDLIIQASANGTVTPSGAQEAAKDHSTDSTAISDAGYAFSHWSVEDGTGITVDDIYAESTTVTLTETGGTVQVNFGLALFLTVSSDGNGTTMPARVVEVVENIPISITAIPATGCQFANWSVENGGSVSVGDVNSSETTVMLSSGDVEIRANFTLWPQVDKLLAADGAATDSFGNSVSISGDYAIIGVPFDDDNGSASGSAFIFGGE
ncbi:MAG: chitobiase/beta-hexosaminidase C-terminal domain-containing protein [Spirochaetales bacterium]|nr:chitobiase/beta-hexosaminidase C-terminal domain-containing protein [Spirochaetales bacterium]